MPALKDGFSTTIEFSEGASAGILLYEKEVTPPGVEGGGPIDITTMLNTTWRSMYPKSLKTLTPASFVAAYDPAVYDQIVAMINNNQLITVNFPDGSSLAFWGWLDAFTPNANTEGDQPTADVTIQPSNLNDSDAETAPVYAAP